MVEKRKKLIYEARKKKITARMPLVVAIILCFLIYNFWQPVEILKWISAAGLIVYLAMGFYYRKKLSRELDELDEQEGENVVKETG